MGKSAYAAGLAIAIAPFALASLGDQIGISKAYLMVPGLIAIAYISIVVVKTEAPHARLRR
jgi:hypothetical protein